MLESGEREKIGKSLTHNYFLFSFLNISGYEWSKMCIRCGQSSLNGCIDGLK